MPRNSLAALAIFCLFGVGLCSSAIAANVKGEAQVHVPSGAKVQMMPNNSVGIGGDSYQCNCDGSAGACKTTWDPPVVRCAPSGGGCKSCSMKKVGGGVGKSMQ